MSYYDIPEELRLRGQWVGADKTKRPYNPRNGKSASVTDSRTWGTFEEAVNSGHPHIGFVFSKDDPYVFVDLDTGKNVEGYTPLHAEIVLSSESYAETSISGKGSHIIVKGQLNKGYRDDTKGIEVYPHGRYAIMTGDQFYGDGIVEDQPLLDYLREKINGNRVVVADALLSQDEVEEDNDLIDKMSSAGNADKFNALYYDGEWEQFPEYQGDRSRADMGLITLLDFNTKNVEQVIRLFMRSKLYRPSKGRKGGDGSDYIIRTLKYARTLNDNDLEIVNEVDMKQLTASDGKTIAPPPSEKYIPIDFPPGLIGEVAEYIYWSSIKPVREVSLMGAIALVAGICGRQYNVSGTGLNQYLILLAATGTGKEGAASGIDRLMSQVRKTMPTINDFIGPADFASGPALIKTLERQPCFFSIMGEFGLKMQQLSHPRANNAEKTLLRAYLNLYSKSGEGQSESALVYSDREKNTEIIYSPSPTIFGESTPSSFYEALSEDMIHAGLLPRFLVIEYKGIRPPDNLTSAFQPPTEALVDRVTDLASSCLQMQSNDTIHSLLIDNLAIKELGRISILADRKINEGNEDCRQLWNRAHLKILRLAGLVAVGINMRSPVIGISEVRWATTIVKRDIEDLTKKFEKDEVGTGDSVMVSRMREKIVKWFIRSPSSKRNSSYNCPTNTDELAVISYTALWQMTNGLAQFSRHKLGSKIAVKTTIEHMLELGALSMVSTDLKKLNKIRCKKLYAKGEHWVD